MGARVCSLENCGNPHKSKGFCAKHYMQYLRGTLGVAKERTVRKIDPAIRFTRHFTVLPNGCWEWTGTKDSTGYGILMTDGRQCRAHRLSWEKVNGRIPNGMFIDHICGYRPCVNPEHLRIVTPKQNCEHLFGPNKVSKTGVRNVYRKGNGYKVEVGHYGKLVYGGFYASIEAAEEAAIELRSQLFTHDDAHLSPFWPRQQ